MRSMWKEREEEIKPQHGHACGATGRGSLHVSAWLDVLLSAEAGAAAPLKNGFVDRQGQEREDEKLPRHTQSCACRSILVGSHTHVSNVLQGAS
jgi:hypothetical protein